MSDVAQLSLEHQRRLQQLSEHVLANRALILASNRGPVEFRHNESGQIESLRGSGGLVTAISAISRFTAPIWIAAAMTDGDREQAEQTKESLIHWQTEDSRFDLRFVTPDPEDYRRYYNEIANPLL